MVGKIGSKRTTSSSSLPGMKTRQSPPEENIKNITMEQLGQFITKTVEEAMKKNHKLSH